MKNHAKMYSLVILMLLLMLFCLIEIFPLIKPDSASASSKAVVQVYPSLINVGKDEIFTVAVVGLNLINLYGFDIEFTWDPSILKYISYTVTCPVEEYPSPNPPSPYSGVLNRPVILVKKVVNESGNIPDARFTETRAWIAYASMYPAESQSGNVTFFTITFQAIKIGESPLKILACDLSDRNGVPIDRIVIDGFYRTSGVPAADFNYWPEISVANKPTYFTANVTGNTTNIAIYMWDFGDGGKQNTTQPTITHIYAKSGEKNVGLKVVDENGVESTWTYKKIFVAASRDLAISNIIFPATAIKVNASVLFAFKVIITNNGTVDENCTVYTYYNTSVVDPANPNLANWRLVSSQSVTLRYGSPKLLEFKINTTTLTVNASYYILANITGIPEGYEEDANNNFMLSSETFLVTNVDIHEIAITNLECVWQSGLVKATPPLIEGEVVTVLLTMENKGTGDDNIWIELFLNNTSMENKTVPISWGETKKESLLRQNVPAGRYNVRVIVKAGGFNTSESTFLHIIKPPKVNFTYTPTNVVKGQLVTFNASITIHQDLGGTVVAYKWEFFAPTRDWTTADPTAKGEGPTVTYNFTIVGNWTIVLKIKDNFGLEFNPKRPATSAYIEHISLNVVETTAEEGEGGPEGIPTEIIAIIIVVVLIIAASAIYLRKRRVEAIEEEISE